MSIGFLNVGHDGSIVPIASKSTLGYVIVGNNIDVSSDGTISAADPYVLPIASATTLGGIKVGANLSVSADGTLSAPAPYTLTGSKITAALGYAPAQLPYRMVYDHSYDGKGLSGSDVSPVKIRLNGDYDAIALIRTETKTYGDREEPTRQRVLLELFTQESGTDSFKSNYIALKGLTSAYTQASNVNPGLIVTAGSWNDRYVFLRYSARVLSLYYSADVTSDPGKVLNAKGCQYHVFGITLDSSILPAAPDYTDIGT